MDELEMQREVDRRVSEAFKEGLAHVYYGLIVLMGLTVIQLVLFGMLFGNYMALAVLMMIEFGVEAGIFVDLFAHGYTH